MTIPIPRFEALDPANIVDIDLGEESFRQIAPSLMADWAVRKPFYCQRRGLPVVVAGRYEDAKEIYLDAERFSVVAPALPGYEIFDLFGGIESVAQMEGERHARVRRLMSPAFTPKAMDTLKDDIQKIVDDKLDAIEARGASTFDAMSDFAGDMIMRVMLDATLKLSPAQQQAFGRVHDSFSLIVGQAPGEPPPAEYIAAGQALYVVMMEIIEERRRNPRNDFISNLISARDNDDALTDDELFGQINSVCAAALGTTASSLGAALLHLGRHPDQFDRLKADPTLIGSAIEECLRYQSSGFFTFPRFATVDTELSGVKIPAAIPVFAAAQAANFDPEEFPDPLRFDITRNPRGILTFGSGAHLCIGNRLARLVIRISLLSMMARFPKLALADPAFQPRYVGMFSELSPVSIPMRIA